MSDNEPTKDEVTETIEDDDTEGNRVLRSQPPREGGGTGDEHRLS